MNDIVVIVAGSLFFIGALLSLARLIIGPSVFDRVAASDALMAGLLCILGFDIVVSHHTFTLPIMLAIAAFAMLGSVAVAKFIRRQDKTDEPK